MTGLSARSAGRASFDGAEPPAKHRGGSLFFPERR